MWRRLRRGGRVGAAHRKAAAVVARRAVAENSWQEMVARRHLNPQPIFDSKALAEFLRENDVKEYHVPKILSELTRQVSSGDPSFTKIAGLPHKLYGLLPGPFTVLSSKVVECVVGAGGDTTKMVVELQDGKRVESVIMKYDPKNASGGEGKAKPGKGRTTLCVSSQVGCQMGCKFCATGTMGLQGNLTSAEIVEQLVHALAVDPKVTNVVFMGMGEPLNNYAPVVEAVKLMTDDRVFGLSPNRVTISTVGVTNRIISLAEDLPSCNLALSLHAPSQDLRLSIVPSGRAYPVPKLLSAVRRWQDATRKKVFLEYVVLGGINDGEEHARELGEVLAEHGVYGTVNLIPWNPTEAGLNEHGYRAPVEGAVETFQRVMREDFGVHCTVRREFGQDINSACGQLVINERQVATDW